MINHIEQEETAAASPSANVPFVRGQRAQHRKDLRRAKKPERKGRCTAYLLVLGWVCHQCLKASEKDTVARPPRTIYRRCAHANVWMVHQTLNTPNDSITTT